MLRRTVLSLRTKNGNATENLAVNLLIISHLDSFTLHQLTIIADFLPDSASVSFLPQPKHR